jgi:beta-glucosidase
LYDNFEWGFGFSKQFGIVYIDRRNGLRRVIKDTGHFFADVIERGGFDVD